MKGNRIITHTVFVFSIFLSACYSDLKDIDPGPLEWSPELALPLINTQITMAEILEEADSSIDYREENGNLVLLFEDDSLFSSLATDFYSLSGRSFPTVPIILTPEEVNTFNTTGSLLVNRSASIDYPNDKLDSAVLYSGQAVLNISEDFPANGALNVSIGTGGTNPSNPDLVSYAYNWNYNGVNANTSDVYSNTFNNVTFRYSGPNANNLLSINYQLQLEKVGNNDLVFNDNSIQLDLEFNQLAFQGLYGDLSTQDISTERNVIELDLFDEIEDFDKVSYYFENPQFSLQYTNSIGVPAEFRVQRFGYYKDGNAQDINYTSVISLPQAELNSTTFTEVGFDAQMKEVLNSQPDSIELLIDGVLDPSDTPENFVTSDSRIQVGYKLEIPLELSLSGLSISEDVAVEQDIDPGNAKYVLFNITTVNELPLDLEFKVVAYNADSIPLRTIFDGLILKGLQDGEASPYNETIEVKDDPNTAENEIAFLNETSYIKLEGALATTNNGTDVVKISSNASITINISVQTQYTIKANNN